MKMVETRGHIPHKCPESGCETNDQWCNSCDGGIFSCTRCGGAEGSLPWECPGEKMTPDQVDEVYARKLDYVEGQWVALDKFSARIRNARIRRGLSIDDVEKKWGWTPGVIADLEAGSRDAKYGVFSASYSNYGQLAEQYGVIKGWLFDWDKCSECKQYIHPEGVTVQTPGKLEFAHEVCHLQAKIKQLETRIFITGGPPITRRGKRPSLNDVLVTMQDVDGTRRSCWICVRYGGLENTAYYADASAPDHLHPGNRIGYSPAMTPYIIADGAPAVGEVWISTPIPKEVA